MPRITFNNNNNAKLSSNVPNLTGTLSNTVIQVGSSADMSNYYDKEDVDGLLENKSDTDHDHYVKTGLLEYNLQEAFEFLRDNTMPETQVKWLIGQYAAPKDHDHYVKMGLANLSLQAAYDGLKKELKDLRDTVSQLVTVVEPKSEYYVEYTLAEPMTTFDMRSTEPTVSSEGYLPTISSGALFTKINLKDGSATVNMNTPISDVESIRIYYPEDNYVVQFSNSNVKRVNYIKGNNLGYLDGMFYECPNLEYADLRSLNINYLAPSMFQGVPAEAEIRMPSNTPESWNNYGFTGQFVYDITGYTVSPTEMTITEPGTYRIDLTVNELDRAFSFVANSAYGYFNVFVHQEPGIQPYIEITRTDPITFDTNDLIYIEESNSGITYEVAVTLASPYLSGFGFEPSQISLDSSNGYSAFCQIMPYESGKPMEFEFVSSGSYSNNVHVTVDGTQVHIISNTYVYESFGICIREKYSQYENYIQVTVYDKPLQSITPDVRELTFTKGVSGVQTIMLELDPGSTERNLTYMTMDQLATDFEFELQDMGGSPVPLAVTYNGGSTTGSFTADIYDTYTQVSTIVTINVEEAGQEEPEEPSEPTKPYYVEYTIAVDEDSTDTLNALNEIDNRLYIPTINGNNPDSSSIIIKLKDGSANKDLNTLAKDVSSIVVEYTQYDTYSVKFTKTKVSEILYFNASNIGDMSYMFEGCNHLFNVDGTSWNVQDVERTGGMFHSSSVINVNLSGWNTPCLTAIQDMFYECSSLEWVNLSGWNTSNVDSMNSMFSTCNSLHTIEGISEWCTDSVTNMAHMFNNCYNISSLDLSNWNVGNVYTMRSMFYLCSNLTSLNMSTWNTTNVTDSEYMFSFVSDGLDFCYDGSNYTNWNLEESITRFGGTFPWNQ